MTRGQQENKDEIVEMTAKQLAQRLSSTKAAKKLLYGEQENVCFIIFKTMNSQSEE